MNELEKLERWRRIAEKLEELNKALCACGHQRSQHEDQYTIPCNVQGCECMEFRE